MFKIVGFSQITAKKNDGGKSIGVESLENSYVIVCSVVEYRIWNSLKKSSFNRWWIVCDKFSFQWESRVKFDRKMVDDDESINWEKIPQSHRITSENFCLLFHEIQSTFFQLKSQMKIKNSLKLVSSSMNLTFNRREIFVHHRRWEREGKIHGKICVKFNQKMRKSNDAMLAVCCRMFVRVIKYLNHVPLWQRFFIFFFFCQSKIAILSHSHLISPESTFVLLKVLWMIKEVVELRHLNFLSAHSRSTIDRMKNITIYNSVLFEIRT